MVDVLRGVDLTLKNLLREIQIVNPTETPPTKDLEVAIQTPQETTVTTNNTNHVTLFNYNIVENEFSKTQKFTSVDEITKFPPIILDLQYVIVIDTAIEHEIPQIKQKIIQIFQENQIISGDKLAEELRHDGTRRIAENNENSYLKLHLKHLSLEALNHFWGMFPDTKFKPCLFYEVTPVILPSSRTLEMTRVRETEIYYGDIND